MTLDYESLKALVSGKKVIVAIDYSGSMNLDDALDSAELAIKLNDVADAKFCFFDSACSDFKTEYDRSHMLNHELSIGRSAGTYIETVFDKIKESGEEFDYIILCTDGYFDWSKVVDTSKIVMLYPELHNDSPDWGQYSGSLAEVLKCALN